MPLFANDISVLLNMFGCKNSHKTSLDAVRSSYLPPLFIRTKRWKWPNWMFCVFIVAFIYYIQDISVVFLPHNSSKRMMGVFYSLSSSILHHAPFCSIHSPDEKTSANILFFIHPSPLRFASTKKTLFKRALLWKWRSYTTGRAEKIHKLRKLLFAFKFNVDFRYFHILRILINDSCQSNKGRRILKCPKWSSGHSSYSRSRWVSLFCLFI